MGINKKAKKTIKFLLVLIIFTGWIFSGWPRIWQNPPIPPEVQEAKAAVADIGLWRDSAGSQIPGTSFAAFNFATEERNDGAYTFTGSNNLNLDEAGNYLFIATLSLDDDSNGRVNYEGRFIYTGSGDFVTLYGSGYSRNNNNDHAWVRVVGLVWGAAANDDVQLEVRRDTDTPTAGSLVNESHFQVVQLHDSAAVGLYTDTSDTASYESQTWTDAPFNNIILENDTSVIQKQAGNTDIRLKKDATTFFVGYGLTFDVGDSNRTQRITKMVAGSTDIEQSFSYTYMRQTSDQYGDPNGMFLYRNSGTATDLSVQAQRGNAELVASTGTTRRTSASGMFVVELPSSAEVLISYDSTGGQDIGGTSGDFNVVEVVNYNDSTSFTKVNNTTVNAEQAMDVLLMGQAAAERSGTSGTRMTAGCRFEIQTVNQTLGGHGGFLRGNESGGSRNYTYNYACSPSGMYAVSLGDDIQFEWFVEGDNGSTDNTIASAVGFSALNLDSLIPTTSIADGTDPGDLTIAPGASITDLDAVTFSTDNGTDSVTALTITLGTGDSDNLSEVRITNDDGSTTYFSAISNPSSDTLNFSGGTPIPVTTSSVQFKVRITPGTHANMPAPQGAEYAITGTVTSFTSTNSQAGTDTDSAIITIDNLSPGNTTSNSGSAGDTEVTINYTTPADTDLNSVVVLRHTSTIIDNPAEGTTYTVGNTIGVATVACVDTTVSPSTADSCTDTGLTNDTAYYYEIFAKDSNGNYATGVVPSGSPFTPAGTPVYSVSITSNGTISYGFVNLSTSTTTAGNGYTQTAQHDGSGGSEKINVKSSDATGGTQWTLGTSVGADTFKHEVSTTTGLTYMTFQATDTYLTASSSVAVNDTVNLDFRLTTPNSSTDYVQKSITITVQAVAP